MSDRFRQTARALALGLLCLGAETLSVAPTAAQITPTTSIDPLATVKARIVQPTPTVVEGQSATALADGTWLILGGSVGSAKVSDRATILDSSFNPLTPPSQHLQIARSGQTATVLPDGTVLIIGGSDSQGMAVSTVERYHPDSKQFEMFGDVAELSRSGHTATLLTDGRILVVGGTDSSGTTREDAVIFDPATGETQGIAVRIVGGSRAPFTALLPSGYVVVAGTMATGGGGNAAGVLYDPENSQFLPLSSAPSSVLPTMSYSDVLPTVQGFSPADGAGGVAVGSCIVIRFSQALLPATPNGQTVALVGPNGAVAA